MEGFLREGRLTVELGVLSDSDVEEGGVEPVQGNADVSDGVENYLCIQVLYQVVVEAEREREGGIFLSLYIIQTLTSFLSTAFHRAGPRILTRP